MFLFFYSNSCQKETTDLMWLLLLFLFHTDFHSSLQYTSAFYFCVNLKKKKKLICILISLSNHFQKLS